MASGAMSRSQKSVAGCNGEVQVVAELNEGRRRCSRTIVSVISGTRGGSSESSVDPAASSEPSSEDSEPVEDGSYVESSSESERDASLLDKASPESLTHSSVPRH